MAVCYPLLKVCRMQSKYPITHWTYQAHATKNTQQYGCQRDLMLMLKKLSKADYRIGQMVLVHIFQNRGVEQYGNLTELQNHSFLKCARY